MEESAVKLALKGDQVNTVYYDPKDLLVQKDVTIQNNRTRQAFTTLLLGSGAVTLIIPPRSLIKSVSVTMTLPASSGTGTSNNYYGLALPQGWGYGLFDRIEYIVGGASIRQKSGVNHYASLMAKCETSDKQTELANLGGQSLLSIGGQGGGNDFINYPSYLTAYCHIDVPFSDIRSLFTDRPLDSSLLDQPVQINLYLNQANRVFSSHTASSVTAALPTSLAQGFWQVELEDFVDPNNSIAIPMRMDRNRIYSMPTIYEQSAAQQTIGQYIFPNYTELVLTGFKKGNLLGVQVMAVRTTDALPGALGSSTVNPFSFVELSNLQLMYNGTVVCQYDGMAYKLAYLRDTMRPSYLPQQQIAWSSGTSSYSAVTQKAYFAYFPLSQYSPFGPTDIDVQGGLDVGPSQLNLRLSTPAGDSAGTQYQVSVTYYFQDAIVFNSGTAAYIL